MSAWVIVLIYVVAVALLLLRGLTVVAGDESEQERKRTWPQ